MSGKIGPIKYIEGEYYTVNLMAIRSDLDVYCENVRVIVPIVTEAFGIVVMVGVSAMMVGSTVITVKEGQVILVGIFKFEIPQCFYCLRRSIYSSIFILQDMIILL